MRTLIRERIFGTTNAGSAVIIKGTAIKPGQTALVRHFALHNSSGEAVDALFGIVTIDGFIGVWGSQNAADGAAAGAEVALPLLEGDTPAVQVTGTSKKSTVIFLVGGEVLDNRPEVVEIVQETPQAAV